MKDEEVLNLTLLKKRLTTFAKERDWEKFHTPKNLAMALNVEAVELLEIFQWMTEEESLKLIELSGSEKKIMNIRDEIADIFVYLLRLCSVLNIDFEKSLLEKIEKNETKYPPNLVRGSSKKYDEY